MPCDGSIQVEDVSLELDFNESTIYMSLVGMAIYLSQERLDASFTVKELASKMSKPTITAMSRLKKLLGYLKQTMGYSMKLRIPEHGQGSRCSTSCGYVLESYSDSDWARNKAHRRSTSAAVHLVNSCTVFAISRSQKVVSLSSAEAELHALVSESAVADAVWSFYAGEAWSTTPWWTTQRPSRLPTRKVLERFDTYLERCCGFKSTGQMERSK